MCRDEGVELAKMPKPFLGVCVCGLLCRAVPPQLQTMFGIIALINLRPMTASGVPLGDVVIALVFAVAVVAAVVASTFVGGGVGIRDIIASFGESWV